jgi:hypothetical protein
MGGYHVIVVFKEKQVQKIVMDYYLIDEVLEKAKF